MKPAVEAAFLVLKKLGETYHGQESMPPKALALANTVVCGAWQYNTFMGRKWEVENCLASDMQKVLEEHSKYLICRQHKTSKTYGDIVKYLTPGLFEALWVYWKLPKPASKYFLVPATSSAETVSHTSYLRTYNRKFLKTKVSPTCNQVRGIVLFHLGGVPKGIPRGYPQGVSPWGCPQEVSPGVSPGGVPRGCPSPQWCTHRGCPTSNQVRKLFHNWLIKLTKNEAALKDLMTQLDAHGRNVQDKHYLLRDPDDDCALAIELVSKVLGEPVPWPAEDISMEQDLADILYMYIFIYNNKL